MLLIIGLAAVALFLFRPAPQPQIMYVPVEVANPQGGGMGCLPVIVIGIMVLLALGVIRFSRAAKRLWLSEQRWFADHAQ